MVRLLSRSWLFVLLFHLCTCLIRDLENGSDKMNEEGLSDNSKELQPKEPQGHNSLALTVTVAILVDVLLILFLNVFMALKKNPNRRHR